MRLVGRTPTPEIIHIWQMKMAIKCLSFFQIGILNLHFPRSHNFFTLVEHKSSQRLAVLITDRLANEVNFLKEKICYFMDTEHFEV